MIFHEQPSAEWTPFDFMLLEAYQILQDEICPKCGHPIWLCRSNSSRVEFKVEGAVCQAERSLREYENNRRPSTERANAKERKEWGLFHYTVPFTPLNVEGGLPSRQEFYEEFAAKPADNEDGTVN
jgi:hypothetical protein